MSTKLMPTDDEKYQADKRIRVAVQELRSRLGLTQTEFGGRIGKGLASVQRYELLAPPKGPVLIQLMNLASEMNETSIAEIFRSALSLQLGHAVPPPRHSGPDPEFVPAPGNQQEHVLLDELLKDPEDRKAWEEFSAQRKGELAQAEMIRVRNDAIFDSREGVFQAVNKRGLSARSIGIDSVAAMRKLIAELKAEGKTDKQIADLIGLEQEEKS
jgi:hypothetical protein